MWKSGKLTKVADLYSEMMIGNGTIGCIGAGSMGIDTNNTPLYAVLRWILMPISVIYDFHESTTFYGIAVGTLNIFQYSFK